MGNSIHSAEKPPDVLYPSHISSLDGMAPDGFKIIFPTLECLEIPPELEGEFLSPETALPRLSINALKDHGAVPNDQTLALFLGALNTMDERTRQYRAPESGPSSKNRYRDVVPNPEFRVRLAHDNTMSSISNALCMTPGLKLRHGQGSHKHQQVVTDYINASHIIPAFTGAQHQYIACQAPLPSTTADMWRMVWQQQSRLIVMLTPLKERTPGGGARTKADRYWPANEGDVCVYDDFTVELISETSSGEGDLCERVIRLWRTSARACAMARQETEGGGHGSANEGDEFGRNSGNSGDTLGVPTSANAAAFATPVPARKYSGAQAHHLPVVPPSAAMEIRRVCSRGPGAPQLRNQESLSALQGKPSNHQQGRGSSQHQHGQQSTTTSQSNSLLDETPVQSRSSGFQTNIVGSTPVTSTTPIVVNLFASTPAPTATPADRRAEQDDVPNHQLQRLQTARQLGVFLRDTLVPPAPSDGITNSLTSHANDSEDRAGAVPNLLSSMSVPVNQMTSESLVETKGEDSIMSSFATSAAVNQSCPHNVAANLGVCEPDYVDVTMLHYLAWPDFGVPRELDSLTTLFERFRTLRDNSPYLCDPCYELSDGIKVDLAKTIFYAVKQDHESKEIQEQDSTCEPPGFDIVTPTLPPRAPAIVHCSAGIGRTGALICIDTAIDAILFCRKAQWLRKKLITRFSSQTQGRSDAYSGTNSSMAVSTYVDTDSPKPRTSLCDCLGLQRPHLTPHASPGGTELLKQVAKRVQLTTTPKKLSFQHCNNHLERSASMDTFPTEGPSGSQPTVGLISNAPTGESQVSFEKASDDVMSNQTQPLCDACDILPTQNQSRSELEALLEALHVTSLELVHINELEEELASLSPDELRAVDEDIEVDVAKAVFGLRVCRPGMIQTLGQLRLVYVFLRHCVQNRLFGL